MKLRGQIKKFTGEHSRAVVIAAIIHSVETQNISQNIYVAEIVFPDGKHHTASITIPKENDVFKVGEYYNLAIIYTKGKNTLDIEEVLPDDHSADVIPFGRDQYLEMVRAAKAQRLALK